VRFVAVDWRKSNPAIGDCHNPERLTMALNLTPIAKRPRAILALVGHNDRRLVRVAGATAPAEVICKAHYASAMIGPKSLLAVVPF
jgi:hypothetical protein